MTQIQATFSDGLVMVYDSQSSVRVVNRGPSPTGKKDYEEIYRHPSQWYGFIDLEARVLAIGHRVQTHTGLATVEKIEQVANKKLGIQSI
jgi:hypothetical protein